MVLLTLRVDGLGPGLKAYGQPAAKLGAIAKYLALPLYLGPRQTIWQCLSQIKTMGQGLALGGGMHTSPLRPRGVWAKL